MTRIHTAKTISAVIVGTLFLFTQLVIMVAIIVGLIVNWLGVGLNGVFVLCGIAAIPCLAGLVVIARLAYDAETDPTNQ